MNNKFRFFIAAVVAVGIAVCYWLSGIAEKIFYN